MKKLKELFDKLPSYTRNTIQFCTKCNKLAYYSDLDTCNNCNCDYDPTETDEVCPKCGSDQYTTHCSECNEVMIESYLDYYVENLEELNETQISSIIEQLEKRINK